MTWLDKKPIIALAPMADMTDSPFCRVCRLVNSESRKGEESLFGASKFVIFREMVSAEAIVRGNLKTLRMCEFDEIEKPIVLQIFGSSPEVIRRAAEKILEKGFLSASSADRDCVCDGIDVNMGCPVPKIAGKGLAGASLMKDHNRAVEIIKALKKANLGLPISVKTRLGWSKKEEILEFAPKLEQAGVDAITIHGRTKIQGYSGEADWEMIRRVKKLIKIPVIANGDIKSAENIKKCLEITSADGVMIGRGALGNPWVFRSVIARTLSERSELKWTKQSQGTREIAASLTSFVPRNDISIDEVKRVVLRHVELHLEHYGEGSMVTFRKHLLYYFKGLPDVKNLKQELVKVKTIEELKEILKKLGN